MRELSCAHIQEAVARLCRQANRYLPSDLRQALVQARAEETSAIGQAVLDELVENASLAEQKDWPICQDTGMAVVFIRLGQDVHLVGGNLEDAVNQGVAEGYRAGYLRSSVVDDPLLRRNTGDNTPAVLHVTLVPGDRLELTVAPKGFGSENMSAAIMLSPSEGIEGIRRFVLATVEKAGPNPCPPIVIGLGLGGTLEKAALLAKQALLLPVSQQNEQPHLALLEAELLAAVNRLGIGPSGLGGQIGRAHV